MKIGNKVEETDTIKIINLENNMKATIIGSNEDYYFFKYDNGGYHYTIKKKLFSNYFKVCDELKIGTKIVNLKNNLIATILGSDINYYVIQYGDENPLMIDKMLSNFKILETKNYLLW